MLGDAREPKAPLLEPEVHDALPSRVLALHLQEQKGLTVREPTVRSESSPKRLRDDPNLLRFLRDCSGAAKPLLSNCASAVGRSHQTLLDNPMLKHCRLCVAL